MPTIQNRHRRLLTCLTVVLVVGAALTGCARHRGELTLRSPALSGAGLDIENPYGSVTVHVDPNAKDIHVRSVRRWMKRGGHGGHSLEDVSINAETTQPVQGRSITHINVDAPMANDLVHVAMTVTTPRCDGVRVRSGGAIMLRGVGGAIQAETAHGHIELRTNDELGDPVALVTQIGDVRLYLSPAATGDLQAEAPSGQVRIMSSSTPFLNVEASLNSYRGMINHGENKMMVRTEDGDIRVQIMKDPDAYR